MTDYTIEGRTLKYKTHVEKFALPDQPAGPAEFRESLELQGGDDAVWRSLSNSYVVPSRSAASPSRPCPRRSR